jgi:nucleotide-binding universal stress UspA family protein
MKTEEKAAVPTVPPMKLERILVPMDFSSASEQALDYAVTLAVKFEARITLIHVVEIIAGPMDPTYGYVPLDDGPLVAASASRLEKIASEKIPAALLESTLGRSGTPYQQITDVAKELNMDLIVISTHGYTGLMHVLMGSTAERIVRHAPCPVLTVRSR